MKEEDVYKEKGDRSISQADLPRGGRMRTRFWRMTAVAGWTSMLMIALALVSPADAQQFSD